MGGIVFDGPTSSNYELDLGPYLFTEDYSGLTAWQVNALAQQALQIGIPPPAASSIIINGTGQSTGGFFPSFSLLPANTEAVPMSGDTCHANCHRLHQHAKALPVFQFTH